MQTCQIALLHTFSLISLSLFNPLSPLPFLELQYYYEAELVLKPVVAAEWGIGD